MEVFLEAREIMRLFSLQLNDDLAWHLAHAPFHPVYVPVDEIEHGGNARVDLNFRTPAQ
jgi:hypothetical protein